MKAKFTYFLIILFVLLYSGCSSSNSEYVFDDVGEYNDSVVNPEVKSDAAFPTDNYITTYKYIILVGVFGSQKEADEFIALNQNKIIQELNWEIVAADSFYRVQLPEFTSRVKAEETIATITKIPEFKNSSMIIRRVKVENPYR